MLQELMIAYLVGAVITHIGLMMWISGAWKKLNKEEKVMGYKYPESAGIGIVAICTLFILVIFAAILWPGTLIILLGVYFYYKFQKNYPEPSSMDEEGDE